MISIWSMEEVEQILLQLDKKRLPFKKYKFSQKKGRLRLLGRGGSAFVYEGEERKKSQRKVAIKVIGFRECHIDSEIFYESTNIENKLRRSNVYKNIVASNRSEELFVYLDENNQILKIKRDVDESLEENVLMLHFMVMEKLEPVISRNQIGEIKITPEELAEFDEKEILKLAYEIGNVICLAHKKNILHRDIKLENIFYDSNTKRYKLGDFGLSKTTDYGLATTRAYTNGYGAPEIVLGTQEKYDVTADIYSFGITIYLLMNGLEYPKIEEQYEEDYVLPRPKYGSDELYQIVKTMCRFYPTQRYQTMDDVMSELEALFFNSNVQAKRQNDSATTVAAYLCWYLGILSGVITFELQWSMKYSLVLYVLAGIIFLRKIQKLRKRPKGFLNFIIFCTLLFYLAKVGTKDIFVVIFLLVIMLFEIEGLIVGTFLDLSIANILVTYHILNIPNPQEYTWFAVTMITLSIVLGFHHFMLSAREEGFYFSTKILFSKNLYWLGTILIYGSIFITKIRNILPGGISWKLSIFYLLETKFNLNLIPLYSQLIKIDFAKVGKVGIVFVLFWVIREKALRYSFIKEERTNIEDEEKQIEVEGYINYASKMHWKPYTEEQLDAIREHRNAVLDKYRMTEGISIEELKNVSNNYEKLTDEEAEDIFIRAINSIFSVTMGVAYTMNFFALIDFEKTVVDVKDVFAIGYVTDYNMIKDTNEEVVLCVVFTNDPYIPVFPIVYLDDFEISELKGKSARQDINEDFEQTCPNLTYPIQELKELEKQIQAEDCVKGNIGKKFMLDQILNATIGSGIFNTKKMRTVLPLSVSKMLEEYGYIGFEKIEEIMEMDKPLNRKYWNKVINRIIN